MRFKIWLEAQTDIRLIGYNKRGEISFNVRGTKYTFWTDAAAFYNGYRKKGTLAYMLRYQPGRAFNLLLKLVKDGRAEQVEPQAQRKEPPSEESGSKWVQKSLF